MNLILTRDFRSPLSIYLYNDISMRNFTQQPKSIVFHLLFHEQKWYSERK